MGSPQGVQRSGAEEGGMISHTGSGFHLKETDNKTNGQTILKNTFYFVIISISAVNIY